MQSLVAAEALPADAVGVAAFMSSACAIAPHASVKLATAAGHSAPPASGALKTGGMLGCLTTCADTLRGNLRFGSDGEFLYIDLRTGCAAALAVSSDE